MKCLKKKQLKHKYCELAGYYFQLVLINITFRFSLTCLTHGQNIIISSQTLPSAYNIRATELQI